MRKIVYFFSVIALTAFMYGCATMMGVKAPEEARRFEKVIDVLNLPKNEIYIKANAWFVETFNSAESVIEFQDKEAGKIMGKYVYEYSEGMYTYRVKQTISIDVRDGKIRFVINDPYFKTISGMEQYHPYSPLVTQKGIDKAKKEWEKLSQSLTAYLSKNDNW